METLPRGWTVSIQINPHSKSTGFTTIVHATKGGNYGYGGRIPGIWFKPGTTQLLICTQIDKNDNACHTSNPLQVGKFSTLEVAHQQDTQINAKHYIFTIKLNGIKIYHVTNTLPHIFTDVKYYSGDPWYAPAKANLKHFKLTTYKHKGAVISYFCF